MKKFIIALASLFPLFVFAQTEVTNYRAGVTEEGITYFLPQTRLRIVVNAVRTIHEPGEYAAYANRYLRLRDVPQTSYDDWKITGFQIEPYGVADTSRVYSIKLRQKTSAPFVELAEDGRLLAINTKSPDEKLLVQPSVTKIVPASGNQDRSNYKTQEILTAGSTAKMAELTASEIYDIRDSRSLLTKGQADNMPKDGEQLRLMLENLDKQEQALLQSFVGTETSEQHVFVFDITPQENESRTMLFRFSKYLGLVAEDDMAGEPYYFSVKNIGSAEPFAQTGKALREMRGVRYVVPGRARVSLEDAGGSVLLRSDVAVAQFGHIDQLVGELFNKVFTTQIVFSPVTGGIVRIKGVE